MDSLSVNAACSADIVLWTHQSGRGMSLDALSSVPD